MLLYPGETRNIWRGKAETNILGETGYNNISNKMPYAISVLPYPTRNALKRQVVLRSAPDAPDL